MLLFVAGCGAVATGGGSELLSATVPKLQQSVRPEVQLNSTVMIMAEWDSRPRADGTSRCTDMVDKAVLLGNDTIHFMVNHFFWIKESNVTGYCYRPDGDHCLPFDPTPDAPFGQQLRLKDQWKACFSHALRQVKKIAILPHLDEADETFWRDYAVFNPLAPLLGQGKKATSYHDILLSPLALALTEAITETKSQNVEINFALEGEMGATLFTAPASYVQEIAAIRAKFTDVAETYGTTIKIGISLNNNQVNGGVYNYDVDGVKQLFDSVDFIGFSNYGIVGSPPTAQGFDDTITAFAEQLKPCGIDLEDLGKQQGKPLQFTEMGTGGAMDSLTGVGGDIVATSAEDASRHPWSGIKGEYDDATDPWKDPELRQYLIQYYQAVIQFLRQQRHKPGSWYVNKAFIWNMDSHDIQALYPVSSNLNGSYLVPEVVCLIKRYNTGQDASDCLPLLPPPTPPVKVRQAPVIPPVKA